MQGDFARAGAEIITISEPGVPATVDLISGPNEPRTYAISVVLPNGEVAVFGGASRSFEFTDANAVVSTGML